MLTLKGQKGATLLELVIVAPLYFLMLFSIVELGRYYALVVLATEGAAGAIELARGLDDLRIANSEISDNQLEEPDEYRAFLKLRDARESVAGRAVERVSKYVSDSKTTQKLVRFVLPKLVLENRIVEHSPATESKDGQVYSGLSAAVIRPGESLYFVDPVQGTRTWVHHPGLCLTGMGSEDAQPCPEKISFDMLEVSLLPMRELLLKHPLVVEVRIAYRPMFPLSLMLKNNRYAVGRAVGFLDSPSASELVFPS